MATRILGRGGGTAEPSSVSREPYAEGLRSSSSRSRDPYGQETQHYRAYSGQHASQPQPHYPPAQAPPYNPQASGQDPYYGSQMGPGVVHEQAVYADSGKRRWYLRIPFLTIAVILACTVVFIVTMGINNCPEQPHYDGMTCVLPFLGRFSFEPTKMNPMLGPAATTYGPLCSTSPCLLLLRRLMLTEKTSPFDVPMPGTYNVMMACCSPCSHRIYCMQAFKHGSYKRLLRPATTPGLEAAHCHVAPRWRGPHCD